MENERDREADDRHHDQNDQQQQPPQPQPQPQPHQGQNKKCPRCESFNTKFCYYNNYNLSQPRHFCKACKRHWTHGGTLRNIPVGGGCRKPRRGRASSPALVNQNPPPLPPPTVVSVALHASKPMMPTLPSISTNGSMFTSLGNPSYFQNGAGFMSSTGGNQSMKNNLLAPASFNRELFNNPQNNFIIPPPPNQFFDVGGGGSQVQPKRMTYDQGLTNSQLLTNDSWQQNFVNSAPDAMWSFNNTGGNGNGNKVVAGAASFDPNQWFDLPGFGPPPTS